MFQKLIRRERHRVQKYGRHGFEVGDIEALYGLQDDAHRLTPVFTIAIVQPGLSRARASQGLLQMSADYLRILDRVLGITWSATRTSFLAGRNGVKQPGATFHSGTLGEGMRAAIKEVEGTYREMIEGWERQ